MSTEQKQNMMPPAVTMLMRVKLQRGPEEIAVLRLASRVSELAVRAIVETAGVSFQENSELYRQRRLVILSLLPRPVPSASVDVSSN